MHIFHFFIPHHKNNHRAKLLHNVSLFVLILAVTFTSSLAIFLHRTHPEVLGISYQISDIELLNLTNYERQQNGLAPLSLDKQLSVAAANKGQHMFQYDYWAHFAPDGTSPWQFIKAAGYDYSYAGENLARGFTTSVDAMNAWMKSPTHRANILSPLYKDVGFAIKEGRLQGEDTVLIVQEFGQRENTALANSKTSSPIGINGTNGSEVKGSYQAPIPRGGELMPQSLTNRPAIDIRTIAKVLTFILLAALLIALVLDFIIIEKKRIPRVVGNNFDHVILITIFIAFILRAKLGNII
jgi:hypothetical protein